VAISQEQLDKSIDILRRFGATKIVLFGSAAESLESARDLDLACDGIDGWEFFRAGAQLEDALRVPVDLVPLSPPSRFTRHIEKWGQVVYESREASRRD
jgi:predicted nucleotidyltransferase